MGTYDGIQLPVSRQKTSASQFGVPVRNAIIDIDIRLGKLEALENPWPTWVPVLTAATTNPTYTVVGNFLNLDAFIVGRFQFTLITVGSGLYSFSIPQTTNEFTGSPIGLGTVALSAAASRLPRGIWQNGGTSAAMSDEAAGARVSNSAPIAFAAGSLIAGKLWYEPI